MVGNEKKVIIGHNSQHMWDQYGETLAAVGADETRSPMGESARMDDSHDIRWRKQ